MKQAMTDLEEHEKEYEPLINSDVARRLDQDFRTAWGKYLAVHEKAVVLAQDNEYQAGLLAQSEEVTHSKPRPRFYRMKLCWPTKAQQRLPRWVLKCMRRRATGSSASWCARC